MFYVYEWYVIETGEVFYVGKGCKYRYRVRKHNKLFNEFVKRYDCDSRIIKTFDTEKEAFDYEYVRISELKAVGQCVCNIYDGGFGGDIKSWTPEKRKKYSEHNVMKSEKQRQRMSLYNPMKNKETALRVGKTKQKAVLINDRYFASVKIGAKHIGTSDIYLTQCIRHRDGLCKGYKCKYANQQPSQGKSGNSTLEGSTTNE